MLEIGASHGDHTDLLLTLPNVRMTLIAPCLDEPLDRKYPGDLSRGCYGHQPKRASTASGEFARILIDGDHN
ncbi:MAG: hypothetical protein H0W86_09340 [Armatimonadetes bacterium]|nr:hypothetical protein [Armatimonadota bacterium]